MSDLFVRYLLGSEKNKDLLLHFVNAVFSRKGHALVVDLDIRNPFNLPDAATNKESILDIKARDTDGRLINVEVQIGSEPGFAACSLYYWAKTYYSQLGSGELYTDLYQTVCINVLDFMLFPELEDFHTCFQITEKDNPEYILTEHLQMHFIEVAKLRLDSIVELSDKLLAWCYYFKNEGIITEEEMPVLLKDDPSFRKAHKEYKAFTADERMMDMAEAREKWKRDWNTRLHAAKEEGVQQGMQQGKRDAARKMQAEGLNAQLISRITGLTEEEIDKL
jgi:predicted transposase/invertase (TIGR01784 family)